MEKPQTLETSMMGIDTLPWGLHDGFNLQYMPSSDEMATYIKDESEELPNQTSLVHGTSVSEAEVGGSFFTELMTNEPDVSSSYVKGVSYNLLSPTTGDFFTQTDDTTIFEQGYLPTFFPPLQNMSSINQMACVKDENNDESALSLGRRHDVKLLPPILHSNSSKKLLVHAKDVKEDLFIASKRVRHHLDNNDEAVRRKLNPVSDDRCLDAKVLQKPNLQPFTSMKTMGNESYDVECKLIQPKSMDTHISKISCRTNQSNAMGNYCVDDEEDVCIIESISAPSRSNLWPMNRKAPVTPQHCTFGDPLNHMGMGGVKPISNEERLIVQVVLQVRCEIMYLLCLRIVVK